MTQREPNWDSARRTLELFRMLYESSGGRLKLEYAAERLGVKPITVERYVKNALLSVYEDVVSLVTTRSEEDRRRRVKYVQMNRYSLENRTGYQLAPMYISRFLLNFLHGTVLDEELQHTISLLERHSEYNADPQSTGRIGKKFFAITVGAKKYAKFDSTVDVLLRGLIPQYELDITYTKKGENQASTYRVRPLTLLVYKQGLYLVADGEDFERPRFFAVERIQKAVRRKESFSYPETYSPEEFCSDTFGIFQGDTLQQVTIDFDAEVRVHVESRTWHREQHIEPLKGGGCRLSFETDDLREVRTWVLSFGRHATVVEPEQLRTEVLEECRALLAAERDRSSTG